MTDPYLSRHSYFINYAVETRSGTDSALGAKLLAGAQASFAIGRFVGTGIMHFVRPRAIFLFFITMCIVFIAPSITQRQDTGIAMIYVTLFFESICFPTIVALGLRGVGRHTKRLSGFIIAGVAGGAFVPSILGATADARSTALAMVVPLCFFVAAWTYALCVNFVPAYRDVVDAFHVAKVGLDADREGADAEQGKVSTGNGETEQGRTGPGNGDSEKLAEERVP